MTKTWRTAHARSRLEVERIGMVVLRKDPVDQGFRYHRERPCQFIVPFFRFDPQGPRPSWIPMASDLGRSIWNVSTELSASHGDRLMIQHTHGSFLHPHFPVLRLASTASQDRRAARTFRKHILSSTSIQPLTTSIRLDHLLLRNCCKKWPLETIASCFGDCRHPDHLRCCFSDSSLQPRSNLMETDASATEHSPWFCMIFTPSPHWGTNRCERMTAIYHKPIPNRARPRVLIAVCCLFQCVARNRSLGVPQSLLEQPCSDH